MAARLSPGQGSCGLWGAGDGVGWAVPGGGPSLVFWPCLDNFLFLPILSLVPDLFSYVAPPETLMDTKWVTSELAWTSHPESGVRLPHHFS